MVSKVLEKLANNRTVDYLASFSDFQYGFRSFRSTVDLLTVVSDRIVRALNRYGATPAVALDISRAFDRAWHAGLLHKLRSYGITGQIFGLISSFLSNRQLRLICNIGIYSDDTTLYSKCNQTSDLWQQLELASEFESDP